MVVDGGNMQSSSSVFAALLNVELVPILDHSIKGIDFVQFGGHVDRCLFLFVKDRSVDVATTII